METVEEIVKIGDNGQIILLQKIREKEGLKIVDLMMVGYRGGFITLSKVEKKHDSGRGQICGWNWTISIGITINKPFFQKILKALPKKKYPLCTKNKKRTLYMWRYII